MKKRTWAAVIGFAGCIVSLAYVGLLLWGMFGGDMGQSDRTGSDGIGYAFALLIIIPLALIEAGALGLTAVLSGCSAVRCAAVGQGRKSKAALVVVVLVVKVICAAYGLFCCALLFSLDRGALYGGAGLATCLLLLCSAVIDGVFVRRIKANGAA